METSCAVDTVFKSPIHLAMIVTAYLLACAIIDRSGLPWEEINGSVTTYWLECSLAQSVLKFHRLIRLPYSALAGARQLYKRYSTYGEKAQVPRSNFREGYSGESLKVLTESSTNGNRI
jgi:hypothetical protein